MLSVSLSPLVPTGALYTLAAIVVVVAALAMLSRGPAAILRALALAIVLAAIANPSLVQEERERVKDIVAVVVDRSTSQTLGADGIGHRGRAVDHHRHDVLHPLDLTDAR
jgi:hypothetical protein